MVTGVEWVPKAQDEVIGLSTWMSEFEIEEVLEGL